MKISRRNTLLTAAGLADLLCFILGSAGYGSIWTTIGAVCFLIWLVLLALVPL